MKSKKFKVICKNCKSSDIDIVPDGYGGEIKIICNKCGREECNY